MPPGEWAAVEGADIYPMSYHDDYNVSSGDGIFTFSLAEYAVPLSEIPEDIRKLICDFHVAAYGEYPNEKDIVRTYALWAFDARVDGALILEFAKREAAIAELRNKIDDESQTWEERRRRIENELEPDLTPEDSGTLDIAMDDLEWLEAKTGCRNEEIHNMLSEFDCLAIQNHENPDDEKIRNALENSAQELESAISAAKKRLQLKLERKQCIKPPMDAHAKHVLPCARTASRAHRGASRPASTHTASSSSGGGGSSGDSSDDGGSDQPPEPPRLRHPLALPLNHLAFNPSHPWRCPGSWRMAEGRRAA